MLYKKMDFITCRDHLCWETLSVTHKSGFHFKLTGKRIFQDGSIHHHFEMSGVEEVKIVSVFSAIGLIAGLIIALSFKINIFYKESWSF